jgi:mRNA interferase MazF
MQNTKNFDEWNFIKKNIDQNYQNKKYHAGDVWWCNIGQNIGFEQSGKGGNFIRPVLVIKGFNKFVCLVVPLTSKEKINNFHFNIGTINNKMNFAILSQIKLVDTKRFINQIGYINSEIITQIKKAIWYLIK